MDVNHFPGFHGMRSFPAALAALLERACAGAGKWSQTAGETAWELEEEDDDAGAGAETACPEAGLAHRAAAGVDADCWEDTDPL